MSVSGTAAGSPIPTLMGPILAVPRRRVLSETDLTTLVGAIHARSELSGGKRLREQSATAPKAARRHGRAGGDAGGAGGVPGPVPQRIGHRERRPGGRVRVTSPETPPATTGSPRGRDQRCLRPTPTPAR